MQITELRILTHDLPGTEKFYREIMGLELMSATKDSCSFFAGSTRLTFTDSALEDPVYHFAFTIPNNKLEEAFIWAKKRVTLLWISSQSQIADFSNWNAKSFYFQDNNGNILEFIARYSVDNAMSGQFQGSNLFSVSEFGIVVADVPPFCNELLNLYPLSRYTRQPSQDHFTVLGDDEGLLIIVKQGRSWYPTPIQAVPFPFRLIFNDDAGTEQQLQRP